MGEIDWLAVAKWAVVFTLALLVIAGITWFYRHHRWLVRSVAPAVAVLVLGGVVLFGTEQGRDLGAALLLADAAQRVWFAVALLYWALATWHCARFPLDRAHAVWLAGPPARPAAAGERWRRWTPRVMGGAVFVFALVHLALAVAAGGEVFDAGLLALLVVGMAAVYAVIVVFRRRAGRAAGHRIAGRAPAFAQRLDVAFEPRVTGAGQDALLRRAAPASWLAFLLFFLAGLIIAVMAWSDPWGVGDAFGSMALGFFAFGGFLTGLVVLWMVSEWRGWALPWAVTALLFLSLVVSLTRHYHPVRDCSTSEACLAGAELAAAREDVAKQALRWYRQARQGVAEGEPVPMVIVATAGGGLRAAYWTAVVLGSLPSELGLDLDSFDRHLFAISGVSGGSVGAAFRTALRDQHDDASALDVAVRAALDRDFLAPTLASLAFVDLPSWVLPNFGQTTRGEALERAFSGATGDRLEAPFMSFAPTDDVWRPLLFLNATHQETGRRVITGHVRIDRDTFLDSFDLHELTDIDLPLSTAAHNSARFSYVSPAGRLAFAPTDEDRGWIIDGGYFENFGALTALDLARAALDGLQAAGIPDDAVNLVIVQISSDPAIGRIVEAGSAPRDQARIDEFRACEGEAAPLGYDPTLDREGRLAGNQLLAPLRGVMGSREAHGITASKELARFACARAAAGLPVAYAHFAMCETATPPLGWVLSGGARRSIEAYLDACGNPDAITGIRTAFGGELAPPD
jgi:hypothetical protein